MLLTGMTSEGVWGEGKWGSVDFLCTCVDAVYLPNAQRRAVFSCVFPYSSL